MDFELLIVKITVKVSCRLEIVLNHLFLNFSLLICYPATQTTDNGTESIMLKIVIENV